MPYTFRSNRICVCLQNATTSWSQPAVELWCSNCGSPGQIFFHALTETAPSHPFRLNFMILMQRATVWGTGAAWSCGRPVQPVASLGGWQFPLSTGKEVFLGPSPSATATVPGGDQGSERPEPQTFVTTGVQLWGTSLGIWPVEAEEFVGFKESSASSCRRSWTTDPGWFVPCGGPETCAAAKASLAVGGWESGQR